MKTSELATILKIVGEENRMNILCLLFKNEKLCVSIIAQKLKLSIATTSHHLKILEQNKILDSKREGKEICYSITNLAVLSEIKNLICNNTNIKIK